jgi:hypothetical protein
MFVRFSGKGVFRSTRLVPEHSFFYQLVYVVFGRENTMARSKKSTSTSSAKQPRKPSKGAQWGTYVDFRLEEESLPAFEKFCKEEEGLLTDLLDAALFVGYKLSVSHDIENDCFIACFTGKPDDDVDLTCVLTARAETMTEALYLLAYKHSEVLKGSWTWWIDQRTRRNKFG